MSWWQWVLTGIAVIFLVSWPISAHNTLVSMQAVTRDALQGIDIELTRRWELIPRLADVARAYADHEADLLERVALRRSAPRLDGSPSRALGAVGDHVVADESAAEAELGGALDGLRALAEAYPDLRSSQHYGQLMGQLRDTEDRIAAARRLYNGNVARFNATLKSFPALLVKGGMAPADYWVIADPAHAGAPSMNVRTTATQTPPTAVDSAEDVERGE